MSERKLCPIMSSSVMPNFSPALPYCHSGNTGASFRRGLFENLNDFFIEVGCYTYEFLTHVLCYHWLSSMAMVYAIGLTFPATSPDAFGPASCGCGSIVTSLGTSSSKAHRPLMDKGEHYERYSRRITDSRPYSSSKNLPPISSSRGRARMKRI
jgi:hypothetical protein